MSGKIKIKLKEVIDEKKISKNKVCHKAEMQMTQLNKYYRQEVTRLDTDVLARICHALDCKIEDILEYIPENKN